MIARGLSFILQGIDATTCEVEVDLSSSNVPATMIVGLPDTAVRESLQRVRTAIRNSGYRYPHARVIINLAPADTPKEGPVYDLPIAVALLRAASTIDPAAEGPDGAARYPMAGELALDGRVRPIRGAVSLALLARGLGSSHVILPEENAAEAAVVDGIRVIGVSSLSDVVELLNARREIRPHPPVDVDALISASTPPVDFAEVRGQEAAKRALMIAAAGAHNLLMVGPPGTGKSMLARALGGILPPLTREEALEVTRIYSSVAVGRFRDALVVQRPVRAPHHTASSAAIVGGGSVPRPGEVSLAHRGVLFLDELPEFSRQVLETLRQPLEDGEVTIARAHGSVRFPARFMLVAALNPTRQGDGTVTEATQRSVDRYLAKLSRPLVDRIDLHVEVPPVPYRRLTGARSGADTASMRAAVLETRAIQRQRQGAVSNAELGGPELDAHARMEPAARELVASALDELGLSARAYDRIRRVGRTIADLEQDPMLRAHHVAEAVQYRLLDRAV